MSEITALDLNADERAAIDAMARLEARREPSEATYIGADEVRTEANLPNASAVLNSLAALGLVNEPPKAEGWPWKLTGAYRLTPAGALVARRLTESDGQANAIRALTRYERSLDPATETKAVTDPTPDARTRGALPSRDTAHSPDFRSVRWNGTDYTFTGTQAAIVEVLWNARENGTPEVGDHFLIQKSRGDAKRLSHVFKGHPAWGTMIIEGSTKGTRRLGPVKES